MEASSKCLLASDCSILSDALECWQVADALSTSGWDDWETDGGWLDNFCASPKLRPWLLI